LSRADAFRAWPMSWVVVEPSQFEVTSRSGRQAAKDDEFVAAEIRGDLESRCRPTCFASKNVYRLSVAMPTLAGLRV